MIKKKERLEDFLEEDAFFWWKNSSCSPALSAGLVYFINLSSHTGCFIACHMEMPVTEYVLPNYKMRE